jgi:hypothetical protein
MAQEVTGSGPVTVTDESKHVSLSLSLSLSLEAKPLETGEVAGGGCWGLTKKGESGVWPAPLNWPSLGETDSSLFCRPLSPLMGHCLQTSQLFLIR